MDDDRRRDIQEAVFAAENALSSLYSARDYLNSASAWGWFDMLGGGFISTYVKRSKMRSAADCIEEARQAMAVFRRELADVDQAMPLAINEGDFWTFADYFFDGFFVDFMVQDQIQRARRQVDDAIYRVTELREQLVNLLV